jgi:hypothetical protein
MRPARTLRTAALLAALAASGVAARALAGDLVFGVGTNTLYDDNVYGSSTNEVGDFSLQFVPKARYIDRSGTLGLDIRYDPTYEYFIDEDPLRGWNHSARAVLDWSPNAATTVSFEDDLARYQNARLLTTTDSSGTPVEGGSSDPLLRNVGSLSVRHDLSSTSRFSASARYGIWDYSDSSFYDQDNYGVELELLHTIRQEVQAGASVSVSHSAFKDAPGRANADTTYYSAAGVIEWKPTDRVSLAASVGPAFVDAKPQAAEPPPGSILLGPIPNVEAGQSVTAFVSASVSYEIERGELSLSYDRQDDFGSGLSFSAVTDSVTARGRYDILENLTADLSVLWEGRKGHAQYVVFIPSITTPGSLQPVLIEGDQELNSVSASFLVTYLITETTKLAASTAWRSQRDHSEVPSGYGDLDRLQVGIWVTYQFAAIRW